MPDYKFPVTTQLRLDWSELDLLGHINNVMYFKFLQASRIAYGDKMGLLPNTEDGIGYILADTRCSFLKQLYFPGTVTVHTSMEFMKNTSFGLYHRIMNDKEELVAEGRDVVVLYDFGAKAKTPLTPELRERVEALEGRKIEPPANQ